jgi:hypothetical protein
MQTVATANVNDDADSAGMPHVNTGLPSFQDAGPLPPELQSSCPTPLPRPCEKAVHDSKWREALGKRQRNGRHARSQHSMSGVRRNAPGCVHLKGVVGKDRKQSVYAEESDISSDDDGIKTQMRMSVLPRAPSGNISKADKLRQAGLQKKKTLSVRIAVLEEPELRPDAATRGRVTAMHALSTPPPTP